MKTSTLEGLQPILDVLRGHLALDEMRPAEFHLKGREFLHFHESPDGVVADVLLKTGRVSLNVTSPGEQAELLERIAGVLQSLEAHTKDRTRRARRAIVR